jgi:transcriptional regulator with XRE-family HTH domain
MAKRPRPTPSPEGLVIAANIRRLLKERQMTRYRLAVLIGTNPNTLYQKMKGQVPEVTTLLAIGVALRSDLNTLVKDVNKNYDEMIATLTSSVTDAGVDSRVTDLTDRDVNYAGLSSSASSRIHQPEVASPPAIEHVSQATAEIIGANPIVDVSGHEPGPRKAGHPSAPHARRGRRRSGHRK